MGAKLEREWNKTMRHVKAICDTLESADEYRALVALRALIARKEELEKYQKMVIDAVGADNIGNALTMIKTRTHGRVGPFQELPEQLQRIPKLWLEGRPQTRKASGVIKLTVYQAEKAYKRLLPYLMEVWEIVTRREEDLQEGIKEEIIEMFETTSPDEMTTKCYAFINDYDLEEEEIESGVAAVLEKVEPTTSELMRTLENMKFDYGVVGQGEEKAAREEV